MKHGYKLLIVFLSLSLTGCVREELTWKELKTIRSVPAEVSELPPTKAHLESGRKIAWDASEVIGVFSDVQDVELYRNGKSPDGTVSNIFSGPPVSGTEFWAFFPGDGGFQLDPDNRNLLSFTYEADDPAIGTNPEMRIPMVAKMASDAFKFRQTMGMIHFSIQGEHVIKYLRLRGNEAEALAGPGTIDLSESNPVFVLDGTDVRTELFCRPVEPYSIPADGKLDVYFPVPKTIFESGLTLDICYLEGDEEKVVTKLSSRWLSVNRAIIKSFAVVDLDQLIEESAPITYQEPNAVDLGIVCTRDDGSLYKVLFAECNLGATRAEEAGCFYGWGETEPKKRYDWLFYKWCSGADSTFAKYNGNPELGKDGFVDGKTVLDPEDDAASVNLGGKWRMPTKAEMEALAATRYNSAYEWEWKTIQDTPGWEIVQSSTGNSIFLPASGYWSRSSLLLEGKYGRYWTSSLYDEASKAYSTTFTSNYFSNYGMERDYGLPIRPVIDAGEYTSVSVTGISLDKEAFSLVVGEKARIKATITPLEATNQDIRWSTSDWEVATVSKGEVTAKAPGRVTIYARTADGDFTASCTLVVIKARPSYSVPAGAVDLGLSVYWATCNLGADAPEQYGDYYAWGELEPYYEDGYSQTVPPVWKSGKEAGYAWGSYKFNPAGDGKSFTRYTGADYSRLLKEDDAAWSQLGGAWRMPSIDELFDLMYGCTWTWQENYRGTGVKGYLVSADDNSIFLPVAGGWEKTEYTEEKIHGAYASSSLRVGTPEEYRYLILSSKEIGGWSFYRYVGLPIRPVYGDDGTVSVAGVSLDRTRLNLYLGEAATLAATITPGDASNKTVLWESGDEQVATVSSSGKVTACGVGRTTITAVTEDGSYSASCKLTVKDPAWVPAGTVDLGVSVYWATCNLGAETPEQYGDYYAWAEVEPFYADGQALSEAPSWKPGKEGGYVWGSLKYNPSGDGKTFTRYNNSDRQVTLLEEDDAASVRLGSPWRMPTSEEFDELLEDCTWTWKTNYQGTGINGYLVSGNGNAIFLPAASARRGTALFGGVEGFGTDGNYWSSSRYYVDYGISLWFAQSYHGTQSIGRDWGYPIRPVREN